LQLVHLLVAIIVLGVGGACFGTSAVFCRAKGLILHESALFAHRWLILGANWAQIGPPKPTFCHYAVY